MTTTIAARPQAQFFNLKSPLLSQGRLDNIVATTPLLSVVLKVYASGGENTMHMHANEDHTFVVLQGQASFRINSDDNIKVVNKNEGVMLPRGVLYWFQSSGADNLVMLRVGASEDWVKQERSNPYRGNFDGTDGRLGSNGLPLPGDSIENKQVDPIVMPGKFFGS